MPLRIILVLILLVNSSSLYSQFYLQANGGIENPYDYKQNWNNTPNSRFSNVEIQKFRFFRTQYYTLGVLYNYGIPWNNKRINLQGGLSVGGMNQFIADTLLSPELKGFVYNIRHYNVFLSPELGFRVRAYKDLSVVVGIEGFFPLRKWIVSEQEIFIYTRKNNIPGFYYDRTFGIIGLQYDWEKFNVGIRYNFGPNTSWHWVTLLTYIIHDTRRWMVSLKYEL